MPGESGGGHTHVWAVIVCLTGRSDAGSERHAEPGASEAGLAWEAGKFVSGNVVGHDLNRCNVVI